MFRQKNVLGVLWAAVLATAGGCSHTCNKCGGGLPPGAIPVRPGSPPPGPLIPPTAVPAAPVAPAPPPAFPGASSYTPAEPSFPASPLPATRFSSPNIGRAPEVLLPETGTGLAGTPRRPAARLMSPELSLPGERPAPPPDPVPAAATPVGIADFTPVSDRVATGRRPMLDGLDWLVAHGYRSVLHVKRPGDDDASDRRQAELRGLDYYAVEAANGAAEFERLVGGAAPGPVFVYDRDGSAGRLVSAYLRRPSGQVAFAR